MGKTTGEPLEQPIATPPATTPTQKRKRSDAPLIWARDGDGGNENAKTHPAYLLSSPPQSENIETAEEYVWVQWASNGTISHIPKSNISPELSPRRNRMKNKSYNEIQSQSINDEHSEDNPKATKRKRLSLSKKQRLHWREQNEQYLKDQIKKSGKKHEGKQKEQVVKQLQNHKMEQNKCRQDQYQHLSSHQHQTSFNNHPQDKFLATSTNSTPLSTEHTNFSKCNPTNLGEVHDSLDHAILHGRKEIEIIEIDDDVENDDGGNVISGDCVISDTCGKETGNVYKTMANHTTGDSEESGVAEDFRIRSQADCIIDKDQVFQSAQSTEKVICDYSHHLQGHSPQEHQQRLHLSHSIQPTAPLSPPSGYPYTHRSSAYVQHIAEACTLIMTDARWRACSMDHSHGPQYRCCRSPSPLTSSSSFHRLVGANNGCNATSIFSWEKGDDLSAVKAFMSLYDEPETKESVAEETKEDANASNDDGAIEHISHKNGLANISSATKDSAEDDRVFERAMHIYSRMFHRKGPWFDLADLYVRYYAPKPHKHATCEPKSSNDSFGDQREGRNDNVKTPGPLNGSTNADTTALDATDICDKKNGTINAQEKAKNFFTPKMSRKKEPSSISSQKRPTNFDQDDELHSHLTSLGYMFCDIQRLVSMGLIRSFQSEYECGLVVGNVSTKSNGTNFRGTLLSADDRKEVLRRLGGSKSTNNPSPAGAHTKNEILLQMQSQQSVFSAYQSETKVKGDNSKQKTSLLPVRKHVNHVLVRKLASKVATLLKTQDGNAYKPRKSDIEETLQVVNFAWEEACHRNTIDHSSNLYRDNTLSSSSPLNEQCQNNDILCSIRLREAPLKTLRRCLRLFLCASGGPGSMRGDGTNGWISVSDGICSNRLDSLDIGMRSMGFLEHANLSLLSEDSWNNVVYPGLSSRLGLALYDLKHCFSTVPVTSNGSSTFLERSDEKLALSSATIAPAVAVFHTYYDFMLWEIGAEMRSFVDRSIETYETERISIRRRQREMLKKQRSSMSDSTVETLANGQNTGTTHLENIATLTGSVANDMLSLLIADGREQCVRRILVLCFNDLQSTHTLDLESSTVDVCRKIETDIISLLDTKESYSAGFDSTGDRNSTRETSQDDAAMDDGFISDTERAIVAAAIICNAILQFRIHHSSLSLVLLSTRPWLRHMSFDAILTYIIWDSIPIFERNGRYQMAVSLLGTILLGSTQYGGTFDTEPCGPSNEFLLKSNEVKPSILCLLPRRNRGKAFERLMVDLVHIERLRNKKNPSKKPTPRNDPNDDTSIDNCEVKQPLVQRLCKSIVRITGLAGSVPFSSLRNLARRLKVPLADTMVDVANDEISLLKIRLNDVDMPTPKCVKSQAYCDWTPKTDYAIANALPGDTNDIAVGKRCAFIGWESRDDEGEPTETGRSLNVEELAIEEYFYGRLPKDQCTGEPKGGWVGWHDEGGHVRALFRILCLQDLLGSCPDGSFSMNEHATIVMSPYQSSPHDLHVGCLKVGLGNDTTPIRSFYERRRHVISSFLSKIALFDEQEIIDFLYNTVRKRWQQHMSRPSTLKDAFLQKDIAELRTLSMIAAGFGGQALASMLRCLCFDYRHYSGGLPDLLLARARYIHTKDNNESNFVNLSDWIGESFSTELVEEKNAQRHVSMIFDRDDEFLGCSKHMDASNFSQRRRGSVSIRRDENAFIVSFPPKLELKHNSKHIKIDCMFVEVKSANDRLDARQEDWLNVLDGCTNARVCKFESSKPLQKK